MWTQAIRGRIAEIETKTKRYPTDLTDEEWDRITSFLPQSARKGRKPGIDLREVLNAIRYIARTGCSWRMLPKDFPPWQTVYWWFRRFMRRFLFETIHDVALMIDRERAGREASPSAGVIDSQSVKAPAAQARGDDAGRKISGAQAPHHGRHRRATSHGQLNDGGYRPLRRRAGEAKVIIEACRRHYNTIRPHSALGYRPPAPEASCRYGRSSLRCRWAPARSAVNNGAHRTNIQPGCAIGGSSFSG